MLKSIKMIHRFKKEILKLKNSRFVDQKILQQFLDRIDNNQSLIRDENPDSHFCSFFVPIDSHNKSVYLGNHLKAGGWIPPGGHIQKGETPRKTVKREFYEELKIKTIGKQIKLFNLSVIHMNNPRHNCKTHYDFWYLVETPEIDFDYDQREFSQAAWFSIDKAYGKITYPEYKPVMAKLRLLYQ